METLESIGFDNLLGKLGYRSSRCKLRQPPQTACIQRRACADRRTFFSSVEALGS
jgi:hypothetical protein